MRVIDGSEGEGGGQILRTALALSLHTGEPFRIENIRARRRAPGLRRQHVTAVLAAATIGRARVEGAKVGSAALTFFPGAVVPDRYYFDIGSAGSATLVLQTVLPPLLLAPGPSELTICGGTHNPLAPPYEFIEKCFLPVISRMGPTVQARMIRPGFFPAGDGEIRVQVDPVARLKSLEMLERGRLKRHETRAVVAKLPRHIAERELRVLEAELPQFAGTAEIIERSDSAGPGNYVTLELEFEHIKEIFTGLGRKGVPAETVADELVAEVRPYFEADAPVDRYLADQLILPMALGGGGSFSTLEPTRHLITNIRTVGQFLDCPVEAERTGPFQWTVRVGGSDAVSP